ncbi:hypothetical protein AB0D46_24990 [Streptomyces sp. NPDC048383]|uniref:hypothetical protein n=1 Tax=Streptomyces sp. NPDC048383 TaxID=3155386 RepID=UPI003449DE3E
MADDSPAVELQQEAVDSTGSTSDGSSNPVGAIWAAGGVAGLAAFVLVRHRGRRRPQRAAHRSDT